MAKTTTQQIDTTTADADAYLRGNKNKAYVDLKKTVDLCDQALKGATDPAQKKALDHELKVRQAAIKKFENLYSRAVYHGYGKDLDSSTFAQLAEHVQGKGEKVDGYGKGAGFANFLTDGKPVNKKAVGLGAALGVVGVTSAIIGQCFPGVDAVGWLIGTGVPQAATAIFSNVIAPMFALSPSFAIASIALTGMLVPAIAKFVKGKIKKAMDQSKINKATKEAQQANDNFDALKASASRLTDEQIKNMTFLTDAQRKELADAKKAQEQQAQQQAQDDATRKEANKKAARTSFINSDKELSDVADLSAAEIAPEDIVKIQGEALIARNGQKPVQAVLDAYKKKQQADLLVEYADLIDRQDNGSGGTKASKLNTKIFGGKTFNELLDAMDAAVTGGAKPADEIRKIQEEIMNAPIPLEEKKRFAAYLANIDKIKDAAAAVGVDTKAPKKKMETVAASVDQDFAKATTGLGLETYDPTSADPGQQEQNKRVIAIVEAAQNLPDKEQKKLRDEYIASQMGA